MSVNNEKSGKEELNGAEADYILAAVDLTTSQTKTPSTAAISRHAGLSSSAGYAIADRPRVQRAFQEVLVEAGFEHKDAAKILTDAKDAKVVHRGEETAAPDHHTRLAALKIYGEFSGLTQQINVNIVPTPFADISDTALAQKLAEAQRILPTHEGVPIDE